MAFAAFGRERLRRETTAGQVTTPTTRVVTRLRNSQIDKRRLLLLEKVDLLNLAKMGKVLTQLRFIEGVEIDNVANIDISARSLLE